jgi:D-beta-D-heptose 7-phosphate kinase/D-beta-D-heptose 1-phosphate adenosyltransferase
MIKVFVNGTFDVLHRGHLELLNYAKSLGDFLFVAIDSDARITEKKGSDRPFNNQVNRLAVMQNLKPVDRVAVFDNDHELIDLIKDYRPDIMIVGSDWQNQTVIGATYAKSLKFFDRMHNESTTKIIESYINR